MATLVPIEKNVKISQKIVEQVKRIIFDGGLQPGDRLPTEKDLAEQLKVSRPTLREALTVLEAIGLIEVRPREGSVVKSLVPQSIQEPIQGMMEVDSLKVMDLFEVRTKIDSEGAAMAAERATEAELRKIKEYARVLEERVEEKRSILEPEPGKMYQKTFFCIADAAHNSIYAHFMKSIWTLLEGAMPYSRRKLYDVPNISSRLLKQYREIVEAVLQRKPVQARRAVIRHLNFVGKQFRRVIESGK
jgi:GntR family transcriptional regulator, transcriptional repressor for pyruvate dehydrogenase complex